MKKQTLQIAFFTLATIGSSVAFAQSANLGVVKNYLLERLQRLAQ